MPSSPGLGVGSASGWGLEGAVVIPGVVVGSGVVVVSDSELEAEPVSDGSLALDSLVVASVLDTSTLTDVSEESDTSASVVLEEEEVDDVSRVFSFEAGVGESMGGKAKSQALKLSPRLSATIIRSLFFIV
jgi:hypothetical protein